jgi:glycosyltransferase involved in cell wall biosynthesis
MEQMIRVLIIQQYIPQYRLPLFKELHENLQGKGILLHIAYSVPIGSDKVRCDSAELRDIGTEVKTRNMRFLGRSITLKSVHRSVSQFDPDFIIVEQAVKNVESWLFLAKSRLSRGIPVALWGPGFTPAKSNSWMLSRLKSLMTNMADWFFAYTSSGRELVISHGFKASRVTVVNNSIKTSNLLDQLNQIDDESLESWEIGHGLTHGKTALFLGGVDMKKGIDFLLNSALLIADQLPGFVLLVGGSGEESHKVIDLQRRGGPVMYLGRVTGQEKALALRAASLLMIPEWVGLVAVDSLVSATPLVTTVHPSHAPEFEYLIAGKTCVVSNHDLESYSRSVLELLLDPVKIQEMKDAARTESSKIQFSSTIENFSEGIVAWTKKVKPEHRK